jgi:phosphopantothenoylcysteine decarboxylase/phosphopantothenate--cysteine ligase
MEGAGFKSDTNIITIVDKNGDVEPYPIMTKANVAKVIIDRIISIIK